MHTITILPTADELDQCQWWELTSQTEWLHTKHILSWYQQWSPANNKRAMMLTSISSIFLMLSWPELLLQSCAEGGIKELRTMCWDWRDVPCHLETMGSLCHLCITDLIIHWQYNLPFPWLYSIQILTRETHGISEYMQVHMVPRTSIPVSSPEDKKELYPWIVGSHHIGLATCFFIFWWRWDFDEPIQPEAEKDDIDDYAEALCN